MSVLFRSRKLLISLMRSDVRLKQQSAFGCVCSQSHSLCSTSGFTEKSASCRVWHPVSVLNYHLLSRRFYSDSIEKTSPTNTARLEEESREVDEENADNNTSVRQSPSVTFSLDVLVSLLRQENAADLCVIRVPEHIKYAEYFIVVSGISTRHLRAMALYTLKVYKFLKKDADPNVKIEGKDTEDWMCIDFGKMVVHFMLPETREIYELEKLWTLRAYDEQLKSIPPEIIPEDFVLDPEMTK
ncbi:mitochondrial assembly of ribosomal large subunit protein 1 [Salarias fasciatus]|uniref:Mitochondrial assembly of ribosomal large subunit protein 1 n=1 Tax=Salarias fasciatus TaxID=181472 RepID=A0A672J0L2_SALFA|nr:mitochondrial assembly of ribosomal large subunit protein 1 [Salarias fasciatus]